MRRLSNELVAILGVGVALGLLLYHLAGGLRGEVAELRSEVADLRQDVATGNERLAHIEGWIQGRFREGETSE